jgi:hypothetical protein
MGKGLRVLVYTLCVLLWAARCFAGELLSSQQLEGYWEVKNRQGQKHSVIYLKINGGELQAQGVRVFPTNDGEIEYLCEKCRFTSLYDKPLWSGKYKPLEGFTRKAGSNTWVGGRAISPKRGMILYPRIVFSSPQTGQIQVPVFLFTLRANMKKISEYEALQGCEKRVSAQELHRWGDLDKQKNRQQMFNHIQTTPKAFMKAVNAGRICYMPKN